MNLPVRLQDQEGRHALVDNIPFKLPVRCGKSPVMMAIFPIDAGKAAELPPGNGIVPISFHDTALLVVTVIDYRQPVIAKYIEYSIAIACNHGLAPGKFRLPGLFSKRIDLGQYVIDLPVSSEVSVKGGKGIWGMPKHQGNLDFKITDSKVSSQYDLDGQLCTYFEIEKPPRTNVPLKMTAANFCSFRGMLMKSTVYFDGKAGFLAGKRAGATFIVGDHPRMALLKTLDIQPDPIATAFIPEANGVLDDHFESWFLHYSEQPAVAMQGFESVIDLTRSEEWLEPPRAPVQGIDTGKSSP
jgi:hypothetical protein